jgi:hypothetical protein
MKTMSLNLKVFQWIYADLFCNFLLCSILELDKRIV